ncbi:MAG: bifunctional pyr operon transcriptional regulator/uracil phosphoribosyltransferase [Flavobacteriaceae bacterium]|nr:bifunctional pyr operon transcriptional regulator/uracil phosphoribosyltransferase [Flavobacteriaceae bacterium]|tara:strand:+ start:13755 stop:14303 length:549 start_codon:yes stop_codon:yes gene_type:complete
MSNRLLLDTKEIQIILNRLACQLRETHQDFSNSVLIGIQPRGTVLAKRLLSILNQEHHIQDISNGFIDITFFRDDFRRSEKVLSANENLMEVSVENKKVVLIDDVLYTGRSIRAALTAIDSYGRPSEIELLTLIDRRFSRHLPIQPDYLGRQVDAIADEKVLVHWEEEHGEDAVYIINKANE